MTLTTSLLIAIGLAMDAFAVSLGVGTSGKARDRRSKFRLAFHFGLFQGGMTLIGWLAGSSLSHFMDGVAHWAALVLLVYVGVNMIRSGVNPHSEAFQANPSKGRTLVMLCVATSLDAMAVGLSMALMKTSALFPALVIGLVTAGLSVFGLLAGTRMGQIFGKRMEILGGLILVVLGLQVVLAGIQ